MGGSICVFSVFFSVVFCVWGVKQANNMKHMISIDSTIPRTNCIFKMQHQEGARTAHAL